MPSWELRIRAGGVMPGAALLMIAALGCGGSSETNPGTGGSGASGGGGTGGATTTTGGGGQATCVVDGTLAAGEECDDGNDVAGDGCEGDCTFTCVKGAAGDAKCDDQNPCSGAETCTDQHLCQPGTPLADGTSCGAGAICKGGLCGEEVCGDQLVSAGEECDDGDPIVGNGCDPDCTFSCTAADPSKCAPADACAGAAACDDASHTCLPLVPLADGTLCLGGSCIGGVCKLAACGDSVLDPGESCDDGNAVAGDGCDLDCTFSCAMPAADCPAAPECELAACSALHVCEVLPDAAQNGAACGGMAGFTCQDGACSAPDSVCGNDIVETGEDCDFGAGNGPGTGCENNCTFSCTKSPDSCVDANPCNGAEACVDVAVGAGGGQKCQPGAPLPACSVCPGGLCGGGTCKASTCGDGCVDAAAGEQCEPPNTPACDAMCHDYVPPVCGNAVREFGEQCDDGNLGNLDGCSGVCEFEQDHRVNWLKMQFATDAYCATNALGGAMTGTTVQSQLQTSLDTGIADGSISILFEMLGLDDLTGTLDDVVDIGVLSGPPELAVDGTYNGASDLDWWYYAAADTIDANRNPLSWLPGNITAKVLTAGPGTVTLKLLLGGSAASLRFSSTKMIANLGATSTPITSMNNQSPGHFPYENIDPALVSYATAGLPNAAGAAKLCGNVSAASLALVGIPQALSLCSQGYTASNSMLDVLVGGCTIFFVPQIIATQPDQVDLSVPQLGAGGPYKLSASGATKIVNTCRDKNNVVVPLAGCLQAAAYSAFFKFTSDRVIIR